MKKKTILISASYLVTIIATAIITIKLYDNFLERRLIVDKHRFQIAKERAMLELREKRLAVKLAEEE
jgi:hypothetical protein